MSALEAGAAAGSHQQLRLDFSISTKEKRIMRVKQLASSLACCEHSRNDKSTYKLLQLTLEQHGFELRIMGQFIGGFFPLNRYYGTIQFAVC